ncbi:MAG: SUF system NifU family Fe-S cluster assembly protein [Alphaproteobacteria bacterium]|nr:SUF system NifU family Fe-S cluster assembly protein [Alphaproteobacteria bacterium]
MSDDALRELYQDIILDHGRHPRNLRKLEAPTHLARGHNPLCGDRVTVFLAIDGDKISDVSFDGRGCAISTAAASLMTEVLKGKTLEEARTLFEQFHAKVTGGAPEEPPAELEEDVERLEPLTGVKAYPVRVKCATLPWRTFEAALKSGLGGDSASVKTE